MAGRPIEIPIAITSDKAEQGAEKVVDALEQVEDGLKDLTKAGDKAADNLADDMSDAAKKIDRDLTKALDEVEDKAKTTGKTIGRSVKDGTDKAGEGLGELKDESKSTAKEAAASFGSIEDAADALQEVVANAFVGFGPAGMAAGLVAAVGIGFAISALTENADKINENKEKMLDLAQTIKDNGGTLSESDYIQSMEDYGYAIQDTKEWFEIFQEDAISGFDKIRDGADKAGVSLKDSFLGQFGSINDSTKVLADLDTQLADLEKQSQAAGYEFDMMGNMIDNTDPAIRKQIEGNKELSQKVRDHVQQLQDAAEIERIRRAAIEGTTQATLEDIEAIEKRTDAVKGSISSELSYLDSVDDLTAKLSENGAQLDKNTTAGRDNIRAVLDQASAIEEMAKDSLAAGESTDTVTAKFNSQKDLLVNQLMPAFGGSRDAAQRYVDTVLKVPGNVKTDVLVNDQEARNKLDALTKARTAPLQILPDGTAVEKFIMSQQGRKIFVEFAPRGGGQAIALP
ncbi:hypothetical protein [Arthrobacter sp. Soil762]|uniref:hypothetical protein n=1 Tax=Arthrobacter sp. Soil762 TaxID=1736401 RepID=UPI0006F9D3CF|nr:hypothetical protein [Arthrobacter sp. Soil762]KRE74033.1 hypothetical protein ASG77_04570 [Arthrobacter sp. Soil762]